MFKSSSLSILIVAVLSSTEISIVQGCGRYDSYYWDEVPEEVKQAAAVVGYDEMTWEDIGTNPLEDLRFSDLPIMDPVLDLEALETLDVYDKDLENPSLCWDHFVNHYSGCVHRCCSLFQIFSFDPLFTAINKYATITT